MTLSMRLLPHVSVGLLALILAGCGGGDDDTTSLLDGTPSPLEMALAERNAALAERDAARAERDAALAAVAAAEAAQMVAEVARDAAMAAEAAAETAREAAVAAQAAAVAAQAAAETDRDTAMAAEAAAVAAQATADAAREAAVAAQVAADADRDNAQLQRDAALAAQASAEADRGSALAAQASAEADRDAAISAQTAAETARDLAAAAQMAAERDRDLAEAAQMAAETARDAAVAAQIAADIARVAAEGARDDAQAQRDAAMTAQTAAEAARDAARSERDDARIQLAVAQSALDTARDDLAQARTDATLDAIEIARLGGEVTRLEGEVEDLEGDVAQLNMDLDAANMKLAELEARQSEGNLTASNVAELIDVNETRNAGDVADTAMFGGDAMVSVVHPHASNGKGPGSRMVTVDDDGDADTPTPYASYTAPMSLGTGWYGSAFDMLLDFGAHRVAVVYTNVEAPKRENFAAAYGALVPTATTYRLVDVAGEMVYADANGDAILDDMGDPIAPVADVDPPAGAVVVIAENSQIRTVDFADKPKPGYPSVPTQTRALEDYPFEDSWVETAGSPMQFWALVRYNRNAETTYCGPDNTDAGCNTTGGFTGYFDGVPGTFRCEAEGGTGVCDVVRNGDGTPDNPHQLSSGAPWVFTADNPAAFVDTHRLDGDYLTMGWWIQKPDRAVGTYMFSRYFEGTDPYVGTAAGSATYSGRAAGIWAERVRELENAEFGTFTADVEIDADFTESDINGTIDNFVLSNGDSRNWVVDLDMVTDIGGDGTTSGSADGRSWTGAWDSAAYGNRGADAADQPAYIAGPFRASYGTPEIESMPGTAQGDPGREDDLGFVGVSGVYGAEREGE